MIDRIYTNLNRRSRYEISPLRIRLSRSPLCFFTASANTMIGAMTKKNPVRNDFAFGLKCSKCETLMAWKRCIAGSNWNENIIRPVRTNYQLKWMFSDESAENRWILHNAAQRDFVNHCFSITNAQINDDITLANYRIEVMCERNLYALFTKKPPSPNACRCGSPIFFKYCARSSARRWFFISSNRRCSAFNSKFPNFPILQHQSDFFFCGMLFYCQLFSFRFLHTKWQFNRYQAPTVRNWHFNLLLLRILVFHLLHYSVTVKWFNENAINLSFSGAFASIYFRILSQLPLRQLDEYRIHLKIISKTISEFWFERNQY